MVGLSPSDGDSVSGDIQADKPYCVSCSYRRGAGMAAFGTRDKAHVRIALRKANKKGLGDDFWKHVAKEIDKNGGADE